jgi:hypothetical protein
MNTTFKLPGVSSRENDTVAVVESGGSPLLDCTKRIAADALGASIGGGTLARWSIVSHPASTISTAARRLSTPPS